MSLSQGPAPLGRGDGLLGEVCVSLASSAVPEGNAEHAVTFATLSCADMFLSPMLCLGKWQLAAIKIGF